MTCLQNTWPYMFWRGIAVTVTLSFGGVQPSRAAGQTGAQSPAVGTVREVQQFPKLQDFLSDEPAVIALRVDTFVQRQPGDGTPASEHTVAYEQIRCRGNRGRVGRGRGD